MFQYAAGLALSEHHQTILKMDAGWYGRSGDRVPHERYGLSSFNITEQFASSDEIRDVERPRLRRREEVLLRLANRLGIEHILQGVTSKMRVYFEPESRDDPGFFELPDGTYLSGMWQSVRYMQPVVLGRFRLAACSFSETLNAVGGGMNTAVSVIICTRNRVESLKATIAVAVSIHVIVERPIDAFRQRRARPASTSHNPAIALGSAA